MTERHADDPWASPTEYVPDTVKPAAAAAYAAAALKLTLPLILEYRLTSEERKEGEQQTGTLARTLTLLLGIVFLLGIFILVFGFIYWMIPAKDLPMIAAVTGVLVIGSMVLQRIRRRTAGQVREESPDLVICEVDTAGLLFRDSTSETLIAPHVCRDIRQSQQLYLIQFDDAVLIVPKRVFEDEAQGTAFFALIKTWAAVSEMNDSEDSAASGDEIRIVVTRLLSDAVDRVVTSWRARAMVTGMLSLVFGGIMLVPYEPVPSPVHTQPVATLMMLGICLVTAPVVAFMICFVGSCWTVFLQQPKGELILSGQGIRTPQQTGHELQSWNRPTRYKESRRSFYVWWPDTSSCLVLPKRDFASAQDEDRCRELLAEHSQRSTWLWG